MSEVLRAWMDEHCLDSRTAFYSAQLTYAVPGTGFAFGRKLATVQCKSDTWYLCQGGAQQSGFFFAGTYQWELKAFPTSFAIARGNTREPFSNIPILGQLQNNNLNNFAPLEEAILFRPAELILIDMDVRVGSGVALTEVAFVTLMGIEYQMPSGIRVPGYV